MSKTYLYIFTIPKKSIPFAFLQMAIGRRRSRRIPGVQFAKLMGSGTGERFTPSDADLTKWVLLFVSDNQENLESSTLIQRWKDASQSYQVMTLQAISSHGKWSKVEPFEVDRTGTLDGDVVAITRARLTLKSAMKFWRSIPPVIEDLNGAVGLISAYGIGEAPIGLQGTFSLWESESALRDFAYKGSAHKKVIADTEKYGWYSEELFARFAVIDRADFTHVD